MKTAIKLFLLATLAYSFSGCMAVPQNIDKDFSAAELTQRAQEFLDKKNYKAAAFIYQEQLDRFGSDMSIYVSANFEIAHIYIKQKKWKEAWPILNELHEFYTVGNIPDLPPEYGKLVQIDLIKISEKYTHPGNPDAESTN